MAIRTRQHDFLNLVEKAGKQAEDLYNTLFRINESFAEEFATTKANALDTGDALTVLAEKGIGYADIDSFCNFMAGNLVNFYTGQAVSTGSYGDIIRRIAKLREQ